MSDVCPIFAACCLEFETENDQTCLFSLCKPKKEYESHISAVCRIAYELKNDQSWLFSILKPETESRMYVTFLLGAE